MPSGVYTRKPGVLNSYGLDGHFNKKYVDPQIGEKINLWVVLSKGSHKHNQQRWMCRCECGTEKEVSQQHLRNGKSRSCSLCAGKKRGMRYFGLYGSRRSRHVQIAVKTQYDIQGGLCTLCGKQLPRELSKCAWDHDHSTGKGRDLLHKGCNVFLGFIERNPERLHRVHQYCEKYNIR